MRATALAIGVGLLGFFGAVSGTMAASGQVDRLQYLLEDRDYLALETQLNASPEISRDLRRFYSGVLAGRRNRLDETLSLLGPLLTRPRRVLSAAQKRIGLTTLADSYVKLFRYKDAEDTFSRILRLLGKSLNASETREIADSRQLMTILRDAPPQSGSPASPFEVPIVRDKIGLMEVPVTVAGRQRSWIFDSGANFSLVTRSVAQELGVKLYPGHASVTRTGGVTVQTQAGIIPDLAIGSSHFRNVVVLVVDDADFYIPQLGFQIREILGYPVISALQKISIESSGRLAVLSDEGQQIGTTTLWLEALTPLIALQNDDQPELFVLDLGARHSFLSHRFFERHSELFAGKNPGEMNFGGVSARSVPAYSIAALPVRLGAARIVMNNAPVAAGSTGIVADLFYGIIGQDFLNRFQSFTLDFGAMTFSVGPQIAPSGP